MADYWIKLYLEILDDPKMAVLPDRVWRRIVELFLVAKRIGKDGHLPDTRQIAWMLRLQADELEMDLRQISSTGIVVQEVGGWFIPNFSKRQAAVPDIERKRQERSRLQSRQYEGDVTISSRNVTGNGHDNFTSQSRNVRQSTETETETETEQIQSRAEPTPPPVLAANIITLYQNEVGNITAIIADELRLAEKEYPADWIRDAIHEAAVHNARSWKYVAAVLKRWKAEGRGGSKKNGNGNGQHKETLHEQLQRMMHE